MSPLLPRLTLPGRFFAARTTTTRRSRVASAATTSACASRSSSGGGRRLLRRATFLFASSVNSSPLRTRKFPPLERTSLRNSPALVVQRRVTAAAYSSLDSVLPPPPLPQPARQLWHAGGLTAVRPGWLLDERVCGQEVDVAVSPRSLLQCIAADREVVVRRAGSAARVEHQDAAVVERDLVTVAVDDRIE